MISEDFKKRFEEFFEQFDLSDIVSPLYIESKKIIPGFAYEIEVYPGNTLREIIFNWIFDIKYKSLYAEEGKFKCERLDAKGKSIVKDFIYFIPKNRSLDSEFPMYFKSLSEDLISHTKEILSLYGSGSEKEGEDQAIDYFNEVEIYSFGNDEDPLRFEF